MENPVEEDKPRDNERREASLDPREVVVFILFSGLFFGVCSISRVETDYQLCAVTRERLVYDIFSTNPTKLGISTM